MIKVNAIAYAQLIKCLRHGDMSIEEIANETGLHYVTVCDYCVALYRAGEIHISRWEKDKRGRDGIKIYKLGPGKDARRSKLTPAQRQARVRDKKAAASLLQRMAGTAVPA